MAKRNASKKCVKELACEEPKPLQQETSVREAGEKMRSLSAEKFPVAAGDTLVGTVEGRFPDRKVAGFGHDPSAIQVGESMSSEKFYCYEHQTVEEARKIMRENGLQHLPVVDGDLHIIGILALKEL